MTDDTIMNGDEDVTDRNRLRRAGDTAMAAGRRSIEQVRRAADAVRPHVRRVVATAGRAGRTVVGQARSVVRRTGAEAEHGVREVAGQAGAASRRTGAEAEHGVREVAGQAGAQGERVAETVGDAVDEVLAEAERALIDRPAPGVPYEDWTRQQLYERAQELEVEGRAAMTKAELIDALRR